MLTTHDYPPGNQASQLLLYLTQFGHDYTGGWTHITMPDGSTETFDDRLEKGDIFSFPYDLWHKVDDIMLGPSELGARVALLMPLHPRRGVKTYYKE